MATIFDPTALAAIQRRVDRLRPDAPARWGRMTAPEVVKHLSLALAGGLDEVPFGPLRGLLTRAPFNWLVIHLLPWPKGKAQSPKEFLGGTLASWDDDLRELRTLIDRSAAKGPASAWPASPAFGVISAKSWGVLIYRHLDHHLRQFGV